MYVRCLADQCSIALSQRSCIMLHVQQEKWGERCAKMMFWGNGRDWKYQKRELATHRLQVSLWKEQRVFKEVKNMLCIILFIVAAVGCSPPTGMASCRVYLDYSDHIPPHHWTVQVKTVLLVLIFSRNVKHFVCRCINSYFSTKAINSSISSQVILLLDVFFFLVKLIVL